MDVCQIICSSNLSSSFQSIIANSAGWNYTELNEALLGVYVTCFWINELCGAWGFLLLYQYLFSTGSVSLAHVHIELGILL